LRLQTGIKFFNGSTRFLDFTASSSLPILFPVKIRNPKPAVNWARGGAQPLWKREAYIQALVAQVREAREVIPRFRVVLLAQDCRYTPQGDPDWTNSTVYVFPRWRCLPDILSPAARPRMLHGSDWPFPANALVFWNRLHPLTLLDLMTEKNLFLRDFRLKQALGLPPESFARAADVLAVDREAEFPDGRAGGVGAASPAQHR
jgi:hypothetical protein